MLEWLAKNGHSVRVVTAPPYYPQWRVADDYSAYKYTKEASSDSVMQRSSIADGRQGTVASFELLIYRCPLWIPKKPTGLKRIIHLISFAFSSMPVILAQILWRPDVVIVVAPPLFCSFAALLSARFSRGKVWLHVQDYEVDAAFNLGLLQSRWLRRAVMVIEQWIMHRYDRVSTISGRMLERLEVKGIKTSRRIYFPNWVDSSQIYPFNYPSPFRSILGIGEQDVIALYSGSMGEKQGLEILIEAARNLISESNLHFFMCGHGAAYTRLREIGDGLVNITWLPLQPLEKLNDLLNVADIHLLPQRADAADLVMPSKLSGMLASGRPVVATVNPGTEVWKVVQGRGITVAPDDAQAFAAAIRELAGDAERRESLGRAAREYALAELDKEQVLSRFEAELVRLVEGRD